MILLASSSTAGPPLVEAIWVSPTVDALIVLAIPIVIGILTAVVVVTRSRLRRRMARRRTRRRDHLDRVRFDRLRREASAVTRPSR